MTLSNEQTLDILLTALNTQDMGIGGKNLILEAAENYLANQSSAEAQEKLAESCKDDMTRAFVLKILDNKDPEDLDSDMRYLAGQIQRATDAVAHSLKSL
jgi:hypothetical protein